MSAATRVDLHQAPGGAVRAPRHPGQRPSGPQKPPQATGSQHQAIGHPRTRTPAPALAWVAAREPGTRALRHPRQWVSLRPAAGRQGRTGGPGLTPGTLQATLTPSLVDGVFLCPASCCWWHVVLRWPGSGSPRDRGIKLHVSRDLWVAASAV